jgi:cysteinyl-tRNA synthetase
MKEFVEDILGLRNDQNSGSDDIDDVMNLVIKLRNEAKSNKDFVTSDRIRDELNAIGIQLKDSKEGTLWNKI